MITVSLVDDSSSDRFPVASRWKVGTLQRQDGSGPEETGAGLVLHDDQGRPMAALFVHPRDAVEQACSLFRLAIRMQEGVDAEKARGLLIDILAQAITQAFENVERAGTLGSSS